MWAIVPRAGWLRFCCVRACLSYSLLDRDPSRFLTAQVPSPELYFTLLMPLAKLVLWTDMIQNPEEYLQKELLLFKYFAFVCMYVSEHTCVFMWVFVQVCHKGQRTIFGDYFSPSSCGSWESNSHSRACPQEPFHTKPYHQPENYFSLILFRGLITSHLVVRALATHL